MIIILAGPHCNPTKPLRAFDVTIPLSALHCDINEGDFYLLTRGQPYCTGSDPKLNPGDGRKVLASRICPDGIGRYGKAGERMSAAGGRFIFDDDTSDLLLPLLPPLVHVPAASDSAAPLRAVLELLRLETEAVRPGALVKADPDSKQADASARATA